MWLSSEQTRSLEVGLDGEVAGHLVGLLGEEADARGVPHGPHAARQGLAAGQRLQQRRLACLTDSKREGDSDSIKQGVVLPG